jgi:hypothetical protein
MSDETSTAAFSLPQPFRQLAESAPVVNVPEPVFTCDFPGCDVKKDTLRKLNAHKGQAHKRHSAKKKAAKKAPNVITAETYSQTYPKKAPELPNRQWTFKELSIDSDGRVLMEAPDGGWWIAKKIHVD